MTGILKRALQLVIGTEPVNQASPSAKAQGSHNPKHHHGILPIRIGAKKLTERELIQRESEIGAKIFGEPPHGCRREFFNLDQSTWIWHEETIDHQTRQKNTVTIRYEVHQKGILKVQEGARYSFLEGQELENFLAAVRLYYDRVMQSIYAG